MNKSMTKVRTCIDTWLSAIELYANSEVGYVIIDLTLKTVMRQPAVFVYAELAR